MLNVVDDIEDNRNMLYDLIMDGKMYYHLTTWEHLAEILQEGKLKPNPFVGNKLFFADSVEACKCLAPPFLIGEVKQQYFRVLSTSVEVLYRMMKNTILPNIDDIVQIEKKQGRFEYPVIHIPEDWIKGIEKKDAPFPKFLYSENIYEYTTQREVIFVSEPQISVVALEVEQLEVRDLF